MTEHRYQVAVSWTGATTGYRHYARDHLITGVGRPPIAGSADPAFLGSPDRWNPEQLLLASLSACHKLWFLHLAADAGVTITAYRDEAEATMAEEAGSGRMTGAILRPQVTLAAGDPACCPALHAAAHRRCTIARSVSFPVVVRAPDARLASRDATIDVAGAR